MGNYLPNSSAAGSPSHPSWPFVGHVAQLKAVRQMVSRAQSGAGAVAVVFGEPGAGKSRFLLEAGGRELGSSLSVTLICGSGTIGRPSLEEQLASALGDRTLEGLARQRTVLITVDDVHEATRDDRIVIERLLRAAATTRIVVLAACARQWSGIGSTTPAWLNDWIAAGALPVNLVALDAPRSEILLKAMLSAFAETADARAVAAMLRIAAGSPRYLRELVSRLADVRAGNAPLIPQSAEVQIVTLRSTLEPEAFAILREAAAFGAEFADEWLVRIARRPRGVVFAALQSAVDLGLLRELAPGRPATFAFRDEAIRSALYETLVTGRRKMLHERIASALSVAAPNEKLETLAARHWAEAGEGARAVAALQKAAARAAKRLDFAEAHDLTRKAAALAERDSDAWWSTQEKLADYATSLGEFRGASRIRRRLAQHYRSAGRDDDAIDQLVRLMHDYWYDGRLSMASATHRKLLNLGTTLRGDQLAMVELGWAELCEAAGRRNEALSVLQALPASALTERGIVQQYNRQVASVGCRDRSIAESLSMFEELATRARASGEGGEEYYIATAAATTAAELGLVTEAHAWLGRAGEFLAQHADAAVGTTRFFSLQLCELLLLQGRFDEARDAIADAGLGKRFGEYWQGLLSGFSVFIGLRLGDTSLIAPYFNRMHLHRAIRAGQAEAVGTMLWGYSEMMQSHGLHDELTNALHRCIENDLLDPYFSIQLHCARFGSDDDLRTARKQLDAEVARESNAVARASAKLFDAFAAARQNRIRAATSAARSAAGAYRALEWPWMEALALETAGDRVKAASLYASCGATRDAGRTARRTRKERRAAFGASLTPRELEIRGLVVLGLKNREIAYRLRLSERTVGHHIESIFSKCGVRARWQLGPEGSAADAVAG